MYLVILMLSVALAGCNREASVAPTATPEAIEITAVEEPTPVATSDLTPVPSLTAESVELPESPIQPLVEVGDQDLTDASEIEVAKINTPDSGWIVIYNDDSGQPGTELGVTQVVQGESIAIPVKIDATGATEVMHAILHSDYGVTGEFEYPGPDSPVTVDDQVVQTSFTVDIKVKMPELIVEDQVMVEDGIVVVHEVTAPEDGYVVLFSDQDGEQGRILAYAPVKKGSTQNLSLELNWLDATPMLHAQLYSDEGDKSVFNPGAEDLPIEAAGELVTAVFQVQYPPDVYVLDQPVTTGTIVVEKTVSYGPGWLVVYTDDEGTMGSIIGWALLKDGINEQVSIEVIESAATPQLHLLLHHDFEEVGQFEFPRTDPPVRFNERFPQAITFRTDVGNYLITEDQELGSEGTITVPYAIVDVDAWVVARIDDNGETGDIVGVSHIQPGVNRDVLVPLDSGLEVSQLQVFLHLDAGEIGQFEFPDGLDIPLQRNRSVISSPMTLTTPENR